MVTSMLENTSSPVIIPITFRQVVATAHRTRIGRQRVVDRSHSAETRELRKKSRRVRCTESIARERRADA